jgi:transcriptional regulator of arginine metabolism
MSAKLKRQNLIKRYLNTRIISSHEQMIQLLKSEGIKVTQSTLSRDFADLGVVRSTGEYGARYILSSDESGRQLSRLIGLEILSVEHNESLVVIRTLAGRAQGVAHFLDRMNKEEIMGTIGGDDTVMVIPNTVKNIPNIVQLIHDKMDEAKI